MAAAMQSASNRHDVGCTWFGAHYSPVSIITSISLLASTAGMLASRCLDARLGAQLQQLTLITSSALLHFGDLFFSFVGF